MFPRATEQKQAGEMKKRARQQYGDVEVGDVVLVAVPDVDRGVVRSLAPNRRPLGSSLTAL